jgi:O-antigen ligase
VLEWDDTLASLTPEIVLTGGLGRMRTGTRAPHETYLGLLEELGILGLFAYVIAIWFPFSKCVRLARSRRTVASMSGLHAVAAASAVAIAVAGFSLDLMSERSTWIVLGFAAVGCRVAGLKGALRRQRALGAFPNRRRESAPVFGGRVPEDTPLSSSL